MTNISPKFFNVPIPELVDLAIHVKAKNEVVGTGHLGKGLLRKIKMSSAKSRFEKRSSKIS
ncbi:MAG: hypothetical protein LBF34_00640 [Puniceicoccales bacterium]|jgi:hypothetical protein|nr:hypothetical protein [Puniceicoccales bacterium]